MAGPENDAGGEIELVLGDERVQTVDCGDLRPNASFLIELNLLVVLLSMFALSDDDCMDSDEEEKKSAREHKATEASETEWQAQARARRREINDGKPVGRRSQRFQTTPKDFRHSRRM